MMTIIDVTIKTYKQFIVLTLAVPVSGIIIEGLGFLGGGDMSSSVARPFLITGLGSKKCVKTINNEMYFTV